MQCIVYLYLCIFIVYFIRGLRFFRPFTSSESFCTLLDYVCIKVSTTSTIIGIKFNNSHSVHVYICLYMYITSDKGVLCRHNNDILIMFPIWEHA